MKLSNRLSALVLAASSVLLLAGPASAGDPCQPEWASQLFPLRGVDATVSALAVHDDGSGPALFIGGDFTVAGGTVASRIARFDGTSFTALGPGLDGAVTALAVYDDGSGPMLYAGGDFVMAGGTVVNHVARWNGTSWSALSVGVGGAVRALATYDDGSGAKLYAGGEFTTAGGAGANRFARWNGTSWSALGTGVGDTVNALATFNPGTGTRLYLGGAFLVAGGAAANRIASFDGTNYATLGVGVAATVHALAKFNDGGGDDLYVAGDFTTAGGAGANRIARWSGSAWSTLSSGLNNSARALVAFDDGGGAALYVGGFFSTAGGGAASRVAKWNGAAFSALGAGLSGTANALAAFNDGSGPDLFAGGTFVSAGSASAGRVARWDGAAWSALSSGLDDAVFAAIAHDDGGGPALFVGGNFTSAGAVGANRVAKWNGSAFSALGSGAGGLVNALASFSGSLYAGGNFTSAGGSAASRVARWNGATWSALGSGVSGPVNAIAVFNDGSGDALFVGGLFSFAGGGVASNVAKWNGATWSALGSGVNGRVRSLFVWNDGSGNALYAAGEFTTAGGSAANRVAKWNGAAWSALGAGMNGTVYALASKASGPSAGLYAGGAFTTAGGAAATNVARFDGSTWSAVSGGTNGEVHALKAIDDGSGEAIYAGGDFTTAGGSAANRVAKYDGASWAALAAGTNALVEAIASTGSGASSQIFAGGSFTTAGGSASAFVARWSPGGLPDITSPPASQTVCEGDPVTFSVTAGGKPPLTYQWRKNGSNVGGATGTSLTIDPVAPADASAYDVVVTDGDGCSVTSAAATLAVQTVPVVTTQPVSHTACAGSSTSFTVAASGGGPFSYQWRKGGADLTGATNATLTLDPVVAGDAGSYDVVVSNACGMATSDLATLTVEFPPSITTNPASRTACSGTSTTFTVAATGTAPLSYQWRKNGADIGGANASSFTIDPVAPADAGSYDVVVSNGCGSATSTAATLDVEIPPSITGQPSGATVCEGDPVTFAVTATGTAPLAYQWRKNGTNIGGANGSSYTIDPTSSVDSGDYDVVVSNGCGSVTSATATLVVLVPPSITTHPASAAACVGGSLTLTVVAAGSAPLSYQWRKNGLAMPGETGPSLVFNPVFAGDAGSYDVVVSNPCGAVASDAATVTIVDQVAESLAVDPAIVGGGDGATGTVTISCAPGAGGVSVALSSADPLIASVPASVLVNEGETEATFAVTTSPVAMTEDVILTASLGGEDAIAIIRVVPPGTDCLTGAGAMLAYHYDAGSDVGLLRPSDGETWRFELLDVDPSALAGNRRFALRLEDRGAGSGGEVLATLVEHDFSGAGGHRLESTDLGGVVRSRHDFAAGEVAGTYDIRVELTQRCDGLYDLVPYYRLPAGDWTIFDDGAWTSMSAFDLGQARVVVALDAGADGSLCYSAPIVTTSGCKAGNVNGGVGPVTDVLFVNGSPGDPIQRKIVVSQFDPFTISMAAPPSKPLGPARFVLYAWLGRVTPCTRRTVPRGVGGSCMPMPLSGPAMPAPKQIWNNVGKTGVLGVPTLPSTPAPSTVMSRPAGLRKTATFTLEGLVIDSDSPSGLASITNTITVVSR